MNRNGRELSHRMDSRQQRWVTEVGGDPADPMWHWLLDRGPHGPSFTWATSRHEPPGVVGIELLRKLIRQFSDEDAEFTTRSREIARCALASSHSELVRRGLQVLAVVGTEEDRESIRRLREHRIEGVARDAKAALFELERVTLRQ